MTKRDKNALVPHRWHLLPLLILSGALLIVIYPSSHADLPTHNFAGQCESCHLTSPDSELPMIFAAPIDQLCERCHELNRTNSHPSGVAAIYPVDPVFPLDVGRLLTCASCHNPCLPKAEESPQLLRVPFDGINFCLRCHQTGEVYTGRHVMAAGFVHTKKWTPPKRIHQGQLDPISRNCLGCHDGTINAPDIVSPAQLDNNHDYHPLGADYAQRAATNHDLVSIDRLSGLVSLYEGKVGCASCHSPYASRNKHLVMDNSNSMLCLACHIK